MNYNIIYIIDDVQKLQLEPGTSEKENNNMYGIIGIIEGH